MQIGDDGCSSFCEYRDQDRIKFVLKKVGHFPDFILSCMILVASKLVDGVKV